MSKEAEDYFENEWAKTRVYEVIKTFPLEDAIEEAFDAGAESEKGKHVWHNLKENPNDLPIAVPYGNKSEYKWYLVEVSNSSPGESRYVICTRVHWLDYYGDGRGEDIWIDDMTMTYNVIKWKEIE